MRFARHILARLVLACLALLCNGGCTLSVSHSAGVDDSPIGILSNTPEYQSAFERKYYEGYFRRNHKPIHFIETDLDSVTKVLNLYQMIFRQGGREPEIFGIDVIWPPLLADSLVDLKFSGKKDSDEFSPGLIKNNTVQGRLVAFPMFVDIGTLYYRPSLLKRYGYSGPPQTWDELEQMSAVIQAGERRRGNRNFWGYTFEGSETEALTCSALEWFLSHGGRNFIDEDGVVRVNNPANVRALARAKHWINSISPPGETLYQETDAMNLWMAGQVAFMRNWTSMFPTDAGPLATDDLRFELAPLPSGGAGHFGTLGGGGLAVSRFAANRQLAVDAIGEYTSLRWDRERALAVGAIPTHTLLQSELEVMRNTPLRNEIAMRVMDGVAIRPSAIAGRHWEEASNLVASAVHRTLLGSETPACALRQLQADLQALLSH